MILPKTIKRTGMAVGAVLAFFTVLGLLGRMLTPRKPSVNGWKTTAPAVCAT